MMQRVVSINTKWVIHDCNFGSDILCNIKSKLQHTTKCVLLIRLTFSPITVYFYGFLFNCATVGQDSDSMTGLMESSNLLAGA